MSLAARLDIIVYILVYNIVYHLEFFNYLAKKYLQKGIKKWPVSIF